MVVTVITSSTGAAIKYSHCCSLLKFFVCVLQEPAPQIKKLVQGNAPIVN